MKKIFFCLLLTVITSSFQAQHIVNGVIQDGNRPNLQGLFGEIENNENTNIEGSPYINDEFMPAKISTDDAIYAVRYNGFTDQFEVKGKSDKAYLLNKHRTDIFIQMLNDDKVYKSFKYINEKGYELIGYFNVLSNENKEVILLNKESVKFVEGKKGITSYDDDKPAKYHRNNNKEYIKIQDKPAVELPRNKKDIAKLFPEHSKKVLDYIKSNKIKTSKEADLIQLTNYLNTL